MYNVEVLCLVYVSQGVDGLVTNFNGLHPRSSLGDTEKLRLGIKQLDDDPFEFFMNKNISDIVTAIVQSATQNGIYVQVGKKNLTILIKKNQLAKELENQRPSRFVKGDKLDAIITELDREKRKVSLSIKALEEKQTKEAVKKYGSKDSGGVLGEILGPLLNKKTKKKKEPKN